MLSDFRFECRFSHNAFSIIPVSSSTSRGDAGGDPQQSLEESETDDEALQSDGGSEASGDALPDSSNREYEGLQESGGASHDASAAKVEPDTKVYRNELPSDL